MSSFNCISSRKVASAVLSLLVASPAMAGSIEWNGFGSGYFAQSFKDDLHPAGFDNKYADYTSFSRFGLNLSSEINSQLSAAAQFVAQSGGPSEAWTMVAKWGYLTYRPSDNVSLKVGRQLYPAFIASEFASVGYLLPYVKIPSSMEMAAPLSGFDGVSASYSAPVGDNTVKVTLFTGSGNPSIDIPGMQMTGGVYNLVGLAGDLNGDGYSVHFSASHSESDMTVALPAMGVNLPLQLNLTNLTAGLRYDKNNIVTWAETFYGFNNDKDDAKMKTVRANYALVGYRIGDFMPRYMFSNMFSTGVGTDPMGREGSQINHTIGLNYQVSSQAVVKVEYETNKIEDGYTATTALGTGQNASAVYAGVDFIF